MAQNCSFINLIKAFFIFSCLLKECFPLLTQAGICWGHDKPPVAVIWKTMVSNTSLRMFLRFSKTGFKYLSTSMTWQRLLSPIERISWILLTQPLLGISQRYEPLCDTRLSSTKGSIWMPLWWFLLNPFHHFLVLNFWAGWFERHLLLLIHHTCLNSAIHPTQQSAHPLATNGMALI